MAFREISKGIFFTIVASNFPSRACSLFAIRDSLMRLGSILSISENIFSKVPYSTNNLEAVLAPIPGTPGILSETSPCKALKSGMFDGVTPEYLCSTA